MPVAYNSNLIIPAPTVHISKEYQRAEDGTPIGSLFVITLHGTLTAGKGSPNSSGVFWTQGGGTYPSDEAAMTSYNRLTYLIRKQEAIRKLFNTDGYVFEIDPIFPDSSAPLQCNPRIRSIDIPEGLWFETCPYTVVMEADTVRGLVVGAGEDSFAQYVSRTQEDWAIESADDIGRTYRLTHTLSATGKRTFDATGNLINGGAWQNARLWVDGRLGIDASRLNPTIVAGPAAGSGTIINPTNPSAYNFLRAEHTNVMAGTYGVNETWLVFDVTGLPAPAVEDYTIVVRTDETGRSHGRIDGTVRGLEQRDNVLHTLQTTRIANAQTYWNSIATGLFGRVQSQAGLTLNPTALQTSVGQNPFTGVITYGYEYNDRPPSIVAGSISDTINISYDNPADVVAQVTVLGRALGPVLQAIGTITVAHKTVTIEAQMPAATMGNPNPSIPNTNAVIASYAPVTAIQYFLEKDAPSFNPTTGRYMRTTTWAFEGNG